MAQHRRAVLVTLAVALLCAACTPEPEPEARPSPSQTEAEQPSPSPSIEEDLAPATDEELAACIAGEGDLLSRLGSDPVDAQDAPAQVEEITDRVSELRELEQSAELAPEFLPDQEIEQRTRELVVNDYPQEEADVDRRLLAALGAVPADIDLRDVSAQLVSGQILGYYDSDTDQLVVRSADPDEPLGPSEQGTLAHELEHALADQAFDLGRLDDLSGDEATAFVALVEGDATLVGQRFGVEAFDLEEQQALINDPALAASLEQLAQFPYFLTAALRFSYEAGLAFVCDLYAEGGWDAVDAAYAEPPTTSAEIMFPDRYPTPPVEPRPPSAPGEGWTEVRNDTLGAADLLWLFEAPGDDEEAALDDPRLRVADWSGGRFVLSTQGDATALGLALIGGPTLCESMTAWYDAAFPDAADAPAEGAALARDGPDQDAVIACNGNEVRVGIAPDLTLARAVLR